MSLNFKQSKQNPNLFLYITSKSRKRRFAMVREFLEIKSCGVFVEFSIVHKIGYYNVI